MNICPECPNPSYVERTGKCFECIDGEEPLDAEEEIANAPQQPQLAICRCNYDNRECNRPSGSQCTCAVLPCEFSGKQLAVR